MMRLLTPTSDPYDVMGMYGPGPFRQGVLDEHVYLLPEDRIREGTNVRWVITDDGKAWPVLCGHLIPVVTEDGPTDGRCGQPADKDRGACDGHADEMDHWRSLSEPERAYWEREQERMYG